MAAGDRRCSPACGPSTASRSRCGSTRWSPASGPTWASSSSATTWRRSKAKAAEIERVVEGDPRGGRRRRPSRSRACRCSGSSVDTEALSRYGVPAEAGARRRQGRRAASRSARSSSPGDASRWSSGSPMAYRDDPNALEQDPHPDRERAAAPAHPARPPRGDRRPLDHPARVGRAADHRPGQRPGPRHRLVRRGGPGADRPRGEAPDRLHDRVGRPVREPAAGREAALHRRAARPWPSS